MNFSIIDQRQGAKRILRYLKSTIHHCLHIKPSIHLDLIRLSNADRTQV